MSGLLLFLFLLAVAWLVSWLWPVGAWVQAVLDAVTLRLLRRREHHLEHQVRQVDAQIAQEYRVARQKMNRAAGQSWRDRFE